MAHKSPRQRRDENYPTAACLATGWQRLVGPAIAVNVALFVFVLFEPILATRFLFLSRNEIILARAAIDLVRTDLFLFFVVFVFGIVAPGMKLLAFAYVWYFVDVRLTRQHCKWLIVLGRLAMTEIMLLALLVVAIKGIGIGSIEIKRGLYYFGTSVVGSFLLALWVDQQLERLRRTHPI